MNRRDFLFKTSAAIGGLALSFDGFVNRSEIFARTGNPTGFKATGFGELIPTRSLNTNELYVALPKNFQYNVIGKVGSAMSDGRFTPKLHDGMATFKDGKYLRIVRNHEINDKLPKAGVAIGPNNHYDDQAGGGTTTIVVDPKSRKVVKDFVSLSGTLNNCAGGSTPWGSWISCEETTLGPTKFKTGGVMVGGFAKPHGYCFEVSSHSNGTVPPVPITAMGRFVHEAVAVDSNTGVVYMTEDNDPSGFYRFLPNKPGQLQRGGVLQILSVTSHANYDTRRAQKRDVPLQAKWITIKDPNPEAADTDPLAVFRQGAKEGAAMFARLEGCFAARDGRIYFASTSGGDNKGGQIWVYEPTGRDAGSLRLVFESPDREVLDMPDNICLHPKSNMLFICEDSDYGLPGITPGNYVRILSPDGMISDFAKNITPGKESSEFAGSTFSPDGQTLFVNVQAAGVTLAIWGDWEGYRSKPSRA